MTDRAIVPSASCDMRSHLRMHPSWKRFPPQRVLQPPGPGPPNKEPLHYTKSYGTFQSIYFQKSLKLKTLWSTIEMFTNETAAVSLWAVAPFAWGLQHHLHVRVKSGR